MELTINQKLQKALILHKEGKLEEAETLYQKILKTDLKHADANYNLGVLKISLNKSADAIPLFKTATETHPNIDQYWISYTNALINENQLKEAEVSCKKAIELKPKSPSIYFNLAVTLNKLKRFDEAETSYRKVIELKPDYADAYKNLGITIYDLGITQQNVNRFDEAITNCKKAIELKPDFAEAYCTLGLLQSGLDKLVEAEESYKKAIELKPDYTEAYNFLGILYKQQGRMSLALLNFYKILEIKPEYLQARYHLVSALENEAKIQYRKAFEQMTLNSKPFDANLYKTKVVKKNILIDINTIKHLNKLSEDTNKLYGTYYKKNNKKKYYAVNMGACGIFANEFYMQWNSRFENQVKFVLIKLQINNDGVHTLIELPNKDLFDGGNGVHKYDKYDFSKLKLTIMEKYNLETLDKNTWGLRITERDYCPNISVNKISLLIAKYLDDIYYQH
jgi:tetratricopeptide (TPR) repeat protein